ncbi:zinc-dependent metalloprotease [Myxococcus qinghaiensis]|uniref:zinc-dependent metalloprotease n=1 Tax=Myxococcus qinghaiensis TaxID=2906758 RepID=UPI0020A7A516|nr:zinc-dependent metalloprotease [Myxococcus qinghaiensis]MCP3165614.1 zinc-dependent metalloprotease [Myxococcus qinghaiensis]
MATSEPFVLRALVCAFGVWVMLCVGCGSEPEPPATAAPLILEGPIVAVPRALAPDSMRKLREGLGGAASVLQVNSSETFYLALRKSELGQRWFMSVYLKQHHPESLTGRSGGSTLGVRVVSFRVQNDTLYAFDADDTQVRSTLFDPEEIIEAWPIVTDHRDFNRLGGSDQYILFDPSRGLDRVIGVDTLRNAMYGPGFEVELAFAQRFRALKDGISFEKIFTGHGQISFDVPGAFPEADNHRVTATVSIAFRRYQEGAGYTPTPPPPREHYFIGGERIVPDSGGVVTEVATKWNIHPGMKPIAWVLSEEWVAAQQDPRYKDYDVIGAVKRGVEHWNAAFGFPVFTTRMAMPGESFADDDKNFVILDPDPSYNLAYANTRGNPNTGETLGASVYVNISWLDRAIGVITGTSPTAPVQGANGPVPGAFELRWNGMAPSRLCELNHSDVEARLSGPREQVSMRLGGQSALSTKERVERFFTVVVMHEVGHTLGLRHNFKGSLGFPAYSVMDYIWPLDQEHRGGGVGPYDVSAVRYLYGLSSALPSEPFCTDMDILRDPDCSRYDATSVPLELFHGPAYREALMAALEEGGEPPPDAALNGVLQYVRAGRSITERLRAWTLAVEGIQAPLPPEVLAQKPVHGAVSDVELTRVLQRLYLDSPSERGSIRIDPRPDTVLTPLILGQVRAVLLNVDGVRGYASRRVMVRLLQKLQTFEAYAILREARLEVEARLPTLSGRALYEAENLASHLQQATSPYFP